ncbi:hypothetical protein PCE1_003616 [Barthelona sp. PCE]
MVIFEFRGGLDSLFGTDRMDISIENSSTIEQVVLNLAESIPTEKRHLFIDEDEDEVIRPGICVLIDEEDIDVLDGMETEINDNQLVTFIAMAHGG